MLGDPQGSRTSFDMETPPPTSHPRPTTEGAASSLDYSSHVRPTKSSAQRPPSRPKHSWDGHLRKRLARGSEVTECGQRGSSFDHYDYYMISCPELGRAKCSSEATPPSNGSCNSIGGHGSLPPKSNRLRSRLAQRFRRMRPWTSPLASSRSSRSSYPSSPADPEHQEVKVHSGKERRRRARESESHSEQTRGSSDEAAEAVYSAPTVDKGTRPLAMAGVVLATSDLDRLSLMARRGEGAETPKIK
ncbi:hypothetical protein BGZ61DRAFT_545471 [Ilyonectria robusta]|uniref:uncharacterized protein n=1 Tax=Ilyonectria robusta TaxID=1079257 RepID=UPI001E8D6BB2|nr:uncharacterized protein BGZ61DRAFT_545471 [Ilyonectria robusta]KAH8694670.1 hypothetical protein BGZ61DRAFT_545471 [Ilyonectria robusta]